MPLIGIHGGYTRWSDGKAEAEGLYFVTISVRSNASVHRICGCRCMRGSRGCETWSLASAGRHGNASGHTVRMSISMQHACTWPFLVLAEQQQAVHPEHLSMAIPLPVHEPGDVTQAWQHAPRSGPTHILAPVPPSRSRRCTSDSSPAAQLAEQGSSPAA